MTLEEIKKAVEGGHAVYWRNKGYRVIKDNIGQWLVKCTDNDNCTGLTHRDGVTLNGTPEDFFLVLKGGAEFRRDLRLDPIVHVAIYRSECDTDIRVFGTRRAAELWRDEIASTNWCDAWPDDPLPDAENIGDEYLYLMRVRVRPEHFTETFEIFSTELIGGFKNA